MGHGHRWRFITWNNYCSSLCLSIKLAMKLLCLIANIMVDYKIYIFLFILTSASFLLRLPIRLQSCRISVSINWCFLAGLLRFCWLLHVHAIFPEVGFFWRSFCLHDFYKLWNWVTTCSFVLYSTWKLCILITVIISSLLFFYPMIVWCLVQEEIILSNLSIYCFLSSLRF